MYLFGCCIRNGYKCLVPNMIKIRRTTEKRNGGVQVHHATRKLVIPPTLDTATSGLLMKRDLCVLTAWPREVMVSDTCNGRHWDSCMFLLWSIVAALFFFLSFFFVTNPHTHRAPISLYHSCRLSWASGPTQKPAYNNESIYIWNT